MKRTEITITNKLRQVLTLVVAGKGFEFPPLGVRVFPADTPLGPDVEAKKRKKFISVCP